MRHNITKPNHIIKDVSHHDHTRIEPQRCHNNQNGQLLSNENKDHGKFGWYHTVIITSIFFWQSKQKQSQDACCYPAILSMYDRSANETAEPCARWALFKMFIFDHLNLEQKSLNNSIVIIIVTTIPGTPKISVWDHGFFHSSVPSLLQH